MTSTIPADLFELQAHFETWRTNRKYLREPIPDELWNAAADLSRRYPRARWCRLQPPFSRARFYGKDSGIALLWVYQAMNFQLMLKTRSRILLQSRRQVMS
jgi:hypothetical protein